MNSTLCLSFKVIIIIETKTKKEVVTQTVFLFGYGSAKKTPLLLCLAYEQVEKSVKFIVVQRNNCWFKEW